MLSEVKARLDARSPPERRLRVRTLRQVHASSYVVPEPPDITEGWAVTAALLREMRDECNRRGCRLLVYPYAEPERRRIELATDGEYAGSVLDTGQPHRRIRGIVRELGIGLVADTPPLRAPSQFQFRNNTHLRGAGCLEIARAIQQSIQLRP
jgi:DNA-binding LacI/PurR family transcriptional regulator